MQRPLEQQVPINHPLCLIGCAWFYHEELALHDPTGRQYMDRVIAHTYHGQRAEAHVPDLRGEDAFREAIFTLAEAHHEQIKEGEAALYLPNTSQRNP